MTTARWVRGVAGAGLLALGLAALAQVDPASARQTAPPPAPPATGVPELDAAGAQDEVMAKIKDAAIALPLATALGAALALRPRRRGTPKRSVQIVQTQIILAIIGALVMLVVGASLARAFGVVGAAGLVRYRARVNDPKDAGVMLSTLAVGLAAGVGLYSLSVFAAVFIMVVLWVIESFEPEAQKLFLLKIDTKDPAAVQAPVEALLRRYRAQFELRASSESEVSYQVALPANRSTDALTKALLGVSGATAVDWVQEKKKKPEEG